MIAVQPEVYTLIAMALGLAGVILARLVTVDQENKRLGRIQTLRETGPLTWIGVLIVCPFIYHFQLAVPWASVFGLGVGYSAQVILKIFGSATADAARALARRAATALEDGTEQRTGDNVKTAISSTPAPDPTLDAIMQQIDEKTDRLPPAGEKG